MRLLLVIIILFFGSNLFSQKADSSSVSRWSIGISSSPDVCFRIPYSSKSSSFFANEQRYILIPSMGFDIAYKLTKILEIETGIRYFRKGQIIITPENTWQTPGGTYDPTISNYPSNTTQYTPEKKIAVKYQYIEIPLIFNAQLLNKRFKMFPLIGASANVFVGKTTKVSYEENGVTNAEFSHDFNRNNIPVIDLALIAGVGFSYDVSNKFLVKCEPNYRQFIRPMVDYPVSGYLYSIGMNVGINMKL